MRPSTIVHCFGLLTIFTLFILVGQFLFSSLTKESAWGVYRVFPVTSIPLIAKKIKQARHPELAAQEQAKLKKTQMILHLKSGSEIHGELVNETDHWITLRIDGSEVGFLKSEIEKVFRSE